MVERETEQKNAENVTDEEKTNEEEYKNKDFKSVVMTGKELVVQNNQLIDSFKKAKLQELKLFSFIISKVNPQKPDDMCFKLTVPEIAKVVGIENTQDIYRDISDMLLNLLEKIITIYSRENGGRAITYIPLFSYAKYMVDEGYVNVAISPLLAPYIVNLKRDFTQYKLSNIVYLSSSYAIRLYEMLKKQEAIGARTFYIDELRKRLGVTDKFKAYKDFRLYVIDIAVREINAKTDLNIKYTPHKAGRKFDCIEFDIHKKEPPREIFEGKSLYINQNISEANVQKLLDLGFKIRDIMNMLDYLTNAEAAEAIQAEERIAKGKVRSKKALIRTALKEKWRRNAESEKEKPAHRKVLNQPKDDKAKNAEVSEEKGQNAHMKLISELADKFTSFFRNEK